MLRVVTVLGQLVSDERMLLNTARMIMLTLESVDDAASIDSKYQLAVKLAKFIWTEVDGDIVFVAHAVDIFIARRIYTIDGARAAIEDVRALAAEILKYREVVHATS